MFYFLILLATTYAIISHVCSRYQTIFGSIAVKLQKSPKELALALNPTSLSYLAVTSKLLFLIIIGLSLLTSYWLIAAVVIAYALLGKLVTFLVFPLPSTRWYLTKMKRELQKNTDQANHNGDSSAYAKLAALDIYFTQAARELIKKSNN